MDKYFSIGDKISGYCNGYFGRDDYDDKTCVLVTAKYAVFEYANDYAVVLNYNPQLENFDKQDFIDDWELESFN